MLIPQAGSGWKLANNNLVRVAGRWLDGDDRAWYRGMIGRQLKGRLSQSWLALFHTFAHHVCASQVCFMGAVLKGEVVVEGDGNEKEGGGEATAGLTARNLGKKRPHLPTLAAGRPQVNNPRLSTSSEHDLHVLRSRHHSKSQFEADHSADEHYKVPLIVLAASGQSCVHLPGQDQEQAIQPPVRSAL